MNKISKKTYGARGLLEWHLALPAGEATVKIHFTGGRMGSNGIIAARFTTSAAAIQHLIENSREFLAGKIFIVEG